MIEFKHALVTFFNFTEAEWEITKQYFSREIVEAKSHFLHQGDVCEKLGFVESGLLRSYYYDDAGRDVSLEFFQKGTVVFASDSFNNGTPSNEYIVAYDRSILLTITRHQFKELYERVPRWQGICKNVAEMKNKKLMTRTIQFQTLTTAERYEAFCKEYPEVLANVPLGHIASFLGMDIATLSRLRKKM